MDVECHFCGNYVQSRCRSLEDAIYCIGDKQMPMGQPAPDQNYEKVNHPSHYTYGKVEAIDYMMQVARLYPGDQAILVGNVLKYLSRAPMKGKPKEDIKKAQWYLNKLVEVACQ